MVTRVLRPEDRKVAVEFKERLLNAGIPVLGVRVFGSRARGDFTSESDLDIFLVLQKMTPEAERVISRLAWEVGFDAGLVITTVEYTPEQIEKTPLRESPFLKAVHRDGVAV